MKHPHCDLIKLWAEGAKIERQSYNGIWIDDISPYWLFNENFRVKPEPNKELLVKIDFDHVLQVPVCASIWVVTTQGNNEPVANVKFTFDGETGEFIKVEKI